MTIRRKTPLILALLMLFGAIALWLSPTNTPKAEARTLSNSAIGTITGYYWEAGHEYDGSFRPYNAGECVTVQRKAGGVWRSNVSSTAPAGSDGVRWHCNTSNSLSWWISDQTLADNTTAIRLLSDEGSILVLCTDPYNCRLM